MKQIPILLSDQLKEILSSNGIDPDLYKTAYDGTSIGLDLYNAGPDLKVPPGSLDYKNDWALDDKASDPITSDQFNQLFKNLIPTGLRVALPHEWVGLIKERGSIIKTSLKVRAGVIDPGYTGEVFVNCVNLSAHPVIIETGDKLPFQLVVVRANTHFVPVTEEKFEELTNESTRKTGKIGSSD